MYIQLTRFARRAGRYGLVVCLALTCADALAQRKFVFEEPKMGSPFTITIFTADSARAATTAASAFRLADSLNAILSDYIDSSEINRLSATAGSGRYVQVSQPLFNILTAAQAAAVLSGGAYDITVGPVVQLWRTAREAKAFPDKDSLEAALQKTGYRSIRLDSAHRSVLLEKKGMRLDVGGLGKGFVAAAALQHIQQQGFGQAMVNAGGKIVTGDAPAGQSGWLIGITPAGVEETLLPQLLSLQNQAVSTSGDMYQYVELAGKKYSHIVDPATGLGLSHRRHVTVIAKDGTTADWLSTACSILSIRESMQLLKKVEGAALLVTEMKGGKIKRKASANFKTHYF